MTLTLNLYLDMVKMSHQTKIQVSMSRHSKVIARTDRHTDTQNSMKTFPHTRVFPLSQNVKNIEIPIHNDTSQLEFNVRGQHL